VACRRMRSAAVPRALAVLTAGCARARAAVPSLDPAGFFIALHEGLFARQSLHRRGQQLVDTSRSAVERATEALPPPSGLIPDIAALIWLVSYPAGVVRIHHAVGIMRQFPEPPVQRRVDAIGVSMTVMLWYYLIALRSGALGERRFHGYCPGADRVACQSSERKASFMCTTWS
jgi:hypothetical protein